MTWSTDYLTERGRTLGAVWDRQPYVSALLMTPTALAPLAARRAANLIAARWDEHNRAPTVSSLPYHVVLDPSSACNLRCPLCVQATDPRGRPRQLVDDDNYHRCIGEISGHAIRLDLFNWGEPLLHPRLDHLVSTAAGLGLFTRISTNLSVSRHRVVKLAHSGLHYLVASVDGTTQEVYDRYRVRGSLATVLRNLDAVIAERDRSGARWPLVEWQFLVMPHNRHELDAARQLARELGVDVFRSGGARARMADKLTRSTPVAVGRSHPFLLEASDELSEYDLAGEKRRADEREGCRWLWGKISLNPDGGAAPCVSSWFARHDLGDWRDESVAALWHSDRYRQARVAAVGPGSPNAPAVCDRCAYHRNFIPTPDRDTEPLEFAPQVAAQLREAGLEIATEVESAVRRVVCQARPPPSRNGGQRSSRQSARPARDTTNY